MWSKCGYEDGSNTRYDHDHDMDNVNICVKICHNIILKMKACVQLFAQGARSRSHWRNNQSWYQLIRSRDHPGYMPQNNSGVETFPVSHHSSRKTQENNIVSKKASEMTNVQTKKNGRNFLPSNSLSHQTRSQASDAFRKTLNTSRRLARRLDIVCLANSLRTDVDLPWFHQHTKMLSTQETVKICKLLTNTNKQRSSTRPPYTQSRRNDIPSLGTSWKPQPRGCPMSVQAPTSYTFVCTLFSSVHKYLLQ